MTRYRADIIYGGLPSTIEIMAHGRAQARQIISRDAPAARIVEIRPVGPGDGGLPRILNDAEDDEPWGTD